MTAYNETYTPADLLGVSDKELQVDLAKVYDISRGNSKDSWLMQDRLANLESMYQKINHRIAKLDESGELNVNDANLAYAAVKESTDFIQNNKTFQKHKARVDGGFSKGYSSDEVVNNFSGAYKTSRSIDELTSDVNDPLRLPETMPEYSTEEPSNIIEVESRGGKLVEKVRNLSHRFKQAAAVATIAGTIGLAYVGSVLAPNRIMADEPVKAKVEQAYDAGTNNVVERAVSAGQQVGELSQGVADNVTIDLNDRIDSFYKLFDLPSVEEVAPSSLFLTESVSEEPLEEVQEVVDFDAEEVVEIDPVLDLDQPVPRETKKDILEAEEDKDVSEQKYFVGSYGAVHTDSGLDANLQLHRKTHDDENSANSLFLFGGHEDGQTSFGLGNVYTTVNGEDKSTFGIAGSLTSGDLDGAALDLIYTKENGVWKTRAGANIGFADTELVDSEITHGELIETYRGAKSQAEVLTGPKFTFGKDKDKELTTMLGGAWTSSDLEDDIGLAGRIEYGTKDSSTKIFVGYDGSDNDRVSVGVTFGFGKGKKSNASTFDGHLGLRYNEWEENKGPLTLDQIIVRQNRVGGNQGGVPGENPDGDGDSDDSGRDPRIGGDDVSDQDGNQQDSGRDPRQGGDDLNGDGIPDSNQPGLGNPNPNNNQPGN